MKNNPQKQYLKKVRKVASLGTKQTRQKDNNNKIYTSYGTLNYTSKYVENYEMGRK